MMRPAAKTSTLLAYTKMFIGGNAFAELYGLTCGGMQKCSSRSDKASRPWPCRRRLRGTRAEQEETIARPRAIHHIKLHTLHYQYKIKERCKLNFTVLARLSSKSAVFYRTVHLHPNAVAKDSPLKFLSSPKKRSRTRRPPPSRPLPSRSFIFIFTLKNNLCRQLT